MVSHFILEHAFAMKLLMFNLHLKTNWELKLALSLVILHLC